MDSDLVTISGLSKKFGAVQALVNVSLGFRAGEVHVVLGENGAGKSTMLGCLSGRVLWDSGEIAVDGTLLERGDARSAAELGVVAVYQEFMLVSTLSADENIRVACHRHRWAKRRQSARERIDEVAGRYGLEVTRDIPVGRLSLPERQRVEILRALCERPKLLLLDEATGLLPANAIAALLGDLRRMAAEGIAVVLVTHRLTEARDVADRLTVMRAGRVVSTVAREGIPDERELGKMMVGRDVPDLPPVAAPRPGAMLAVNGICAKGDRPATTVADVDLEVAEGEIMGVAGVDGNGQEELLQAIAGLIPARGGGVRLGDEDLTSAGYRARRARGLIYMPADRRRDGIFPGMTIRENLRVGGAVRKDQVVDVMQAAGIVPPDPEYRADRLSGGNQQRLLLARNLASAPRALLLAHPLRGLDPHAAQVIRAMLLDAAQRGVAIVMALNDIDELVTMCHRWIVMDRGKVIGLQDRNSLDFEHLSGWLGGYRGSDGLKGVRTEV